MLLKQLYLSLQWIAAVLQFPEKASKYNHDPAKYFVAECEIFYKTNFASVFKVTLSCSSSFQLFRYSFPLFRLTPLYLFVIGSTEISTAYLHETSPFWIEDRNDLTCQKYWWRNLLYIQNLYPVKEFCLNWTWSMACEMQFFIVFTFLLFLYAK